ncbi:pentapeptide repeat-containing protein [Streptomyces sp. RLB3-17]|uniref:pentapeptide repeat-containing protein n=1 Tax=Streptomyces sp. RLB3-17 TaxID=2594455 RepID=UPI001162A828|nr:pentapeptide repeat-containing protein [Streptomyces sp. RLB3-17]QDO42888.1 pentapeptide repeat-containing protein [Streptomyces sp. RLB3-17]
MNLIHAGGPILAFLSDDPRLRWPGCGFPGDRGDCFGVPWEPYDRCLAHLEPEERRQALGALSPGAAVDCRGVPFTRELLEELKAAVGNTFGEADFGRARFPELADFTGVTFTGEAFFWLAHFADDALFYEVTFNRDAVFEEAVFEMGGAFEHADFQGSAWFQDTLFGSDAAFEHARFSSGALFSRAQMFGEAAFLAVTFTDGIVFVSVQVEERARFNEVTFGRDAVFAGARFKGDVDLPDTTFTGPLVGPIVCGGVLDLSRAVLTCPIRIRIAAAQVLLQAAQINTALTLDVRYADVNLQDAVLSQPVAINFHPRPFSFNDGPLPEDPLTGQDPRPLIVMLAGVDAAFLALSGVDLSACLFTGAHHLDQLRFEGHVPFDEPPAPWTRRRTIAEEHHWRALPLPGRRTAQTRGWQPCPNHPDPATTPGPKDLAATYRQLRKALEDGKNEPGAADFYYGEMEMRRLDHDTPFGERILLHAYWLVSGYGLRASRALAALGVAMALTVFLMMLWGLPNPTPKQTATGTMPTPGSRIHLVIDKDDPALSGPLSQRWTADRAKDAGHVVLNSVIFRSSDQDLTTAGTWIEMFSRFSEPVLLGLAALAARGRIKR